MNNAPGKMLLVGARAESQAVDDVQYRRCRCVAFLLDILRIGISAGAGDDAPANLAGLAAQLARARVFSAIAVPINLPWIAAALVFSGQEAVDRRHRIRNILGGNAES